MELNRYIDHTKLKADTLTAEIQNLCKEATDYNMYSVCVNTSFVALCKALLKDSDVKVCATVGFPLGACSTESKAFEADDAIRNGANEIDMVMNLGAFKEKDYEYVLKDIATVVAIAKKQDIPVKVIIEACLLTEDEIAQACEIVAISGAEFVKTSTGFSVGGATVSHIKIIKDKLKGRCKIKASGGIKTKEDAISLIEAGANRIGTSSSIDILKQGN